MRARRPPKKWSDMISTPALPSTSSIIPLLDMNERLSTWIGRIAIALICSFVNRRYDTSLEYWTSCLAKHTRLPRKAFPVTTTLTDGPQRDTAPRRNS